MASTCQQVCAWWRTAISNGLKLRFLNFAPDSRMFCGKHVQRKSETNMQWQQRMNRLLFTCASFLDQVEVISWHIDNKNAYQYISYLLLLQTPPFSTSTDHSTKLFFSKLKVITLYMKVVDAPYWAHFLRLVTKRNLLFSSAENATFFQVFSG